MQRRGFTLIELLVVIAIIAILAAILFPVFTTAMNQSKATTCMNNLKQLGAAFQLYAEDHNGRFPNCYWYKSDWSSYSLWFWDIPGYVSGRHKMNGWQEFDSVKNRFMCPLCPKKYPNGADRTLSYAMNVCLTAIPTGQVKSSTKTILLVEGGPDIGANNGEVNYGVYAPDDPNPRWNRIQCQLAKRHNDSANITFCDGHVQACKTGTPYFLDASAKIHPSK